MNTETNGAHDDAEFDEPLRVIKRVLNEDGTPNRVTSLAFHPSGQFFIAGRDSRTAEYWDIARQPRRGMFGVISDAVFGERYIHRFYHLSGVHQVCISADGTRALSCCGVSKAANNSSAEGDEDFGVRLLDLQKGTTEIYFSDHEDVARTVNFCFSDTKAISGGEDGTLRLWDFATMKGSIVNRLKDAYYTNLGGITRRQPCCRWSVRWDNRVLGH